VGAKPRSGAEAAEAAAPALSASDLVAGEIEGVVVRDLRRFADGRGWLAELFRDDEVAGELRPAMAYVSSTAPGAARGPHEHRDQADHFCFIGPAEFELRLWDNRPGSATFGRVMTLRAGGDGLRSVIVPAGVVHAYRNVGAAEGLVVNLPNRLYMGAGRAEGVDEIRHEDDPGTIFRLED
jgi:dTDP-4-dehydrorhamnose 3,5-epimerase